MGFTNDGKRFLTHESCDMIGNSFDHGYLSHLNLN